MTKLLNLEKFVFGLLVFLMFLQTRLILRSFAPQFNEWTSTYLYITDILIAAFVLLWVFRILKEKKMPNLVKGFGAIEIFLGIFLTMVCLSLVITNKFWLSFYSFFKLLEFSVLFLYVKNNFDKISGLKRFWKIFIISAVLQSVVAIAQFIKQSSLGLKHLESPLSASVAGVAKVVVNGQNYIRAYGLFPHPNILAAFLIIAIFGLAYLFLKDYSVISKWWKVLYAGRLILMVTALFFTFSRGVEIVGLLVLFLWAAILFLLKKNYRRPIIVFVAFLFIVSCLLLVVFWSFVTARYDLQALGQSQSLNLRLFYNNVAFDFIKGSPIFGVGQSNFVWSLSSIGLLPAWAYQPVHNIYLLIAAETGLLGLLAFLAFLFFTLKSAWSCRRDLTVSCFLSLVACLLAFGLFDHFLWDLQQGQIIFWMILGIIAGFSYNKQSDASLSS